MHSCCLLAGVSIAFAVQSKARVTVHTNSAQFVLNTLGNMLVAYMAACAGVTMQLGVCVQCVAQRPRLLMAKSCASACHRGLVLGCMPLLLSFLSKDLLLIY